MNLIKLKIVPKRNYYVNYKEEISCAMKFLLK